MFILNYTVFICLLFSQVKSDCRLFQAKSAQSTEKLYFQLTLDFGNTKLQNLQPTSESCLVFF